jgi:hypothetical protein
MRTRLTLTLCLAFVLTAGVATARAGGGNSDAAKACQNGGWQHYVRSDGTAFKNEGACVSYAAHGGKLVVSACKMTSYGDFLLTGAVNTSPNGEFYDSSDGTCSLQTRIEGTLVQAASEGAAGLLCSSLLQARGLSSDGVVPAGGDFGADYWFCVYFVG